MRFLPLAMALLSAAITPSTGHADQFPGPFRARVVKVLDGDTFSAEAEVWPGHFVRVNVRIRGIDAPEMHARCEGERAAAKSARESLASLLAGQALIANIAGAKYYGRVLADVASADGQPVAGRLVGLGLARPYGGGRREGWC